ncbi:ABC transporter ATP-binding protein [Sanguibacter suaedae]|uniref:ABC transporter ATP-binding protein n=1 Tax=Sanguibacter suaedae TaxID=2795737 RepID=UPI0027DCF1D8|nr:ABC transporter ATP-binding protein [Sanguibacter suaedae]
MNFGRSNLHKEEFWALRNVDLEISSGTTIGLIGPNGSGKSTLLKMIGGILQPDSGTVRIRGRLAALLELGAGFHPDLTGRENVYLNASILGLSKQQIDKYFDAIVDFSGIEKFIDTQVKFYSSGMYVRLAFAVAVHVDPDILLVDEVLAVGDEPFQRKCLERIRQFQAEGRTIVMVTHGLDQVAEFCDRAVVLEHGNIVTDGTPREALRALRADFEEARQEEVERQQLLERETLDRPMARFTGIALHTDGGVVLNPELRHGDSMTVLMEAHTEGTVTDFSIGVAVATTLGTVLWKTTTELMEAAVPSMQGTGLYQYHLSNLPLGAGEYTVQTTLTGLDGREIHHVPDAAQFSIIDDAPSLGPLHIDASFDVRT